MAPTSYAKVSVSRKNGLVKSTECFFINFMIRVVITLVCPSWPCEVSQTLLVLLVAKTKRLSGVLVGAMVGPSLSNL